MTTEDLRAGWRKTIEGHGGHCPVCDRWGKIYTRPMNATMIASLLWLHRAAEHYKPDGGWIDVPKLGPKSVVRTNQLPTLRWWGLVEPLDADTDGKKKHSGFWRITPEGVLFVMGITSIPLAVATYNNKVIDESATRIHVGDKLDGFNYDEVMRTPYSQMYRSDLDNGLGL